MLRVRLDEQTLMKLDCVCKNKNLSRSEVVRNGIEQLPAEKQTELLHFIRVIRCLTDIEQKLVDDFITRLSNEKGGDAV